MAIKLNEENNQAAVPYVIQGETELAEAQWLIEEGLFKNLDDYIQRSAQAEINYIKYEEAQKKKQITGGKKKIISGGRKKAA